MRASVEGMGIPSKVDGRIEATAYELRDRILEVDAGIDKERKIHKARITRLQDERDTLADQLAAEGLCVSGRPVSLSE